MNIFRIKKIIRLPDTLVGAVKSGPRRFLSTNLSLGRIAHAKTWAQERSLSANFSLIYRLKPELKILGEKKGFGLLEVLISAVIIIMILAALVFIGRASLRNNEYLRQRAQAIYLAQEGIEMTRQIRDTNWTDGSNDTQWNTLVYNGIDYPFTIPLLNNNYSLKYDNNIKRWHLISPPVNESISFPATPPNITYTRSIKVVPAISPYMPNDTTDLKPYAMKVTSTVTWTSSGQSYTITLSEMMTNWRPDF